MPIKHILLDMDGVLADFFTAALEAHGAAHLAKNYPPGEWEIARVLGIPESDFWGVIDHTDGFWSNLRPYPWAKELVQRCREFAPVTIATSPGFSADCASSKVRWLRRHIDPTLTRYMIGKEKWLMASPGAVLIDDGEHNIRAFREHGGDCILFPQLWNSRHHLADMAFSAVISALEVWECDSPS